MSELKAYRFLGQDEVWPDANLGSDYYLKSEADKAIAEKDAEIASLNGEISRIQNKMCDDVFEGIMPLEHIICLPLQQATERIAELKKQVHDYAQGLYVMQAKAEKEAHHHKYKRCLAMAQWCEARYDEEDAKLNRWGSSWDYVSKEMKYWERWQWRWEELAEKFKEAK